MVTLEIRVISSAGSEHYLDKVGVTGSNPVSPTRKVSFWKLFFFMFLRYRSLELTRCLLLKFFLSYNSSTTLSRAIPLDPFIRVTESSISVLLNSDLKSSKLLNFLILVPDSVL